MGRCRGPWSSGKPAYITTPRYLKLHNDGERYNAGACAMTNPQSPPTVNDPLSNVFIFAQQNRIHVYVCTPPWQHLRTNKQRPSRSKPPLAEKHTATYTYAVTHRLFSSTLPPETTTYPQKEDAKVPECPHPAPENRPQLSGSHDGTLHSTSCHAHNCTSTVIVWSWQKKKKVAASVAA